MNSAAPFRLQQFYLPFQRIDHEKRQVTALCYTSGRVRGDNWNLKYETLKRALKRYMQMPCIREMHGKSAAGSALHVEFDDDKQTATMTLEVVDDQAWKKVLKKVYRGLSIGGLPLLTRGSDIEEFDWIETSLVDRPMDPGALFLSIERVDSGLNFPTIELSEEASDDDLALARGEVEEQLERFANTTPPAQSPQPEDEAELESEAELGNEAELESEPELDREIEQPEDESDSLERFDHNQPRDENGMWTIVGGERVSIHGGSVEHSHIDEAQKRFGLSDEATAALHKAHDEGKVQTDDHLYRTIAHAQAASGSDPTSGKGGLSTLTSGHIDAGLALHGAGGNWESRWASHAFDQAPKLQSSVTLGHSLGLHELKAGDIVHSPSDGKTSTISGKVTKVNKASVDFEYGLPGAATHGMRVKKSELARTGFVRRPNANGDTLHHIEVNRAECIELERAEQLLELGIDLEALQYHAEAVVAVARRADDEDKEEAVSQVVERLLDIVHGEADSAIESVLEHEGLAGEAVARGGEGRNSWRTQPRNNMGEWTDGAGMLNVKHVQHVMRHEGIKEKDHHDEVKKLIANGTLKTRRDVLDHLDKIHDARLQKEEKPAEHKPEGTPPTEGHKPEKTGNSEPKKEDEPAPKGWKAHLKKFAKDTLHSFLSSARKGYADTREKLGRAEDGGEDVEDYAASHQALVERFFDALENADDRSVTAALSAALGVLDGHSTEEELERLLASEDVPMRENLEGPTSGEGSSSTSALDALRDLLESTQEGDREQLIAALRSALLEVNRGEGVVSLAPSETLARFEQVQGAVTRLEGELSTARTEHQAALGRAQVAEGKTAELETQVADLGSQVTDLGGLVERMRRFPSSSHAQQFSPNAVERTFAANDLLPNPAQSAQEQRKQLVQRKEQLISEARGADPVRRGQIAEELAGLDAHIMRL